MPNSLFAITRCYRWCVDSDSADEDIPNCCITQTRFLVLMRDTIWTNSEPDRFGSPIQTSHFFIQFIFMLSSYLSLRYFVIFFRLSSEQFLFQYLFWYLNIIINGKRNVIYAALRCAMKACDVLSYFFSSNEHRFGTDLLKQNLSERISNL